MALNKQVYLVRFTGLDNKSDPKQSLDSTIDVLENMMATRRTDGGIELRKRYGFVNLPNTIFGLGNTVPIFPGTGRKIAPYGKGLLCHDGLRLFSLANSSSKWALKGWVNDIAANVTRVIGNSDEEPTTGASAFPIDCDVAYSSSNNLACYVQGRSGALSTARGDFAVQDMSTDVIVGGRQTLGASQQAANVRVVCIGTDFFIFYWDKGNNLKCAKVLGSNPTAINTTVNVATNVNGTYGIYDVIADTVNSRILVAYRNTTPTLTIMVWNTNMTAGTTQAYATSNPDLAIGFVDTLGASAISNLAVASTAAGGGGFTGAHMLTFNTSTLVVSADASVDTNTDILNIGGFTQQSGQINIYYSRGTHGGTTATDGAIWGWNSTTLTPGQVIRSLSMKSRPFSLDGNTAYILTVYVGSDGDYTQQRSAFLLTVPASFNAGTRIDGFILNDSYGMTANVKNGLCGAGVMSSTRALLAISSAEPFSVTNGQAAAWSLNRVDMDFSGALTGDMVNFNGGIFIPNAAAKYYDGNTVSEYGFYVRPEPPTLSQSAGGSLTANSLVQFVAVYSWRDATGRLWRSAPSGVSSITLTPGNQTITCAVSTCRVTDRTQFFQTGPGAGSGVGTTVVSVDIEYYATKPNESVFYLTAISPNNTGVDTVSFQLSSNPPGNTEVLYTQGGEVANEYPPCVLSFCEKDARLFAQCGDQSVWYSKERVDGVGAPSASLFRIPFDNTVGGAFTAIASMDTGIVISKRNDIYIVTGQGPTPDGNSLYQSPIRLPADAGMVSPRGFCRTKDGIMYMSAKGMMLLDRGGVTTPIEGIDSLIGTTFTGGVSVDDRPFSVFATTGSMAVYDWQFKQWYVWTGLAAIGACRWGNQIAIIGATGTISVETPGTYADTGGNYTTKANIGWVNIGETFSNGRLYGVELLLEAKSSTTVSVTLSYDYDTSNADAPATRAVTSSDKGIYIIRNRQRRCQAVYISITETSSGQGIQLSAIGAELGIKQGSRKQPASKFLT